MVGVAEWKELLPTSEALHSLSTLSLHSLYTLSTLSLHSPGSRLARPWPVLRPVYGQPDLTLALRCSYHGPAQLAWRSAYLLLPTTYLPTYLPTYQLPWRSAYHATLPGTPCIRSAASDPRQPVHVSIDVRTTCGAYLRRQRHGSAACAQSFLRASLEAKAQARCAVAILSPLCRHKPDVPVRSRQHRKAVRRHYGAPGRG